MSARLALNLEGTQASARSYRSKSGNKDKDKDKLDKSMASQKSTKSTKSKKKVKDKAPSADVLNQTTDCLQQQAALGRGTVMYRYRRIRDTEAGGLSTIQAELYFHGFITQERAVALFEGAQHGDFLVRQLQKINIGMKSKAAFRKYVILIYDKNHIEEVLIRYSRRTKVYYVNEVAFASPAGLIAYHRDNKVALDRNNKKLILNRPILKADFEVNHEQICRIKRLGDGAFGEVFRGTMRTGFYKHVPVAVKILNSRNITEAENEQLLKEAQMMCTMRLSNDNIVDFLGIACYETPIMILMELCKGALLDEISKTGPEALSVGERIHYCCGTAKGLAFLRDKNSCFHIIHRDIAARNSLIGFDNEAKISDFGLSVIGEECKVKKLQKVPIRYLAPETLKGGLYTPKSDVWSFGVLMWEVFNDGKEPYFDIPETKDVKKAVLKGLYPNTPGSAPEHVWKVALQCFTKDHKLRPHADWCAEQLSSMYSVTAEWMPNWLLHWTKYKHRKYLVNPPP